MARAAAKLLRSDERTIEHRVWAGWMSSVTKTCERFYDEIEDDPFAYNETASVSVLVSAAAMSGMLGIAEFRATKGHPDDRRRAVSGRCDLWLMSAERSWAFEFKQVSSAEFSMSQLVSAGNSAESAARQLRPREADSRVAGLIVSNYWVEGEDGKAASADLAREYAKEWEFAWEIPRRHEDVGSTFLYFHRM